MPTDEVRRGTDAVTSRVRTGPRHAAPKKPLFTRLQVPAGKAIAIAAMPTAVLMGMGLTPQLAQAKPGVPENPFQDGPCVTAPDEQSKDAEKEKAEADAEKAAKDKAEQDAKDKAEQDAKDKAAKAREDEADRHKDDGDDGGAGTDKPEPTPTSTPSPSADAEPDAKADAEPEPKPEPTETRNPLDPLGLGDAIKDVLTPGDADADDGADKESPKPSDPTDDKDTGSRDGRTGDDKADDGRTGDDTSDEPTERADDPADKAKDEAEDKTDDAEDKAKDDADDKATDEPEPEESKDPMAPDANGKKPFPCVVEKKVAGDDEQPAAPIPNQPWHLEASSLLLKGSDYQGVVNLKMPNGQTKQALKYVISGGTDIGDLHQIVEGPGGKKYHVQAAKGSTSTIRGGDTTMYTERISGNLFGLIPVTFDPEHPPPLNIPLIYFTDVKVQQAGQFGGELTIPGLHQSITD
ncbi:hypothetical protein [Streptomyces sp. NPDC059063]|uniref:hypothetical protein n=1 Tax=unclassified Streptomyces TaxID=2593676 RepID=UPI003677DCEB